MIEHKKFDNGFNYIEIRNAASVAKVALQGAHLFHYEPVGEKPVVWLSQASFFESGEAIRGGVPVCWPWFGKHPTDSALPQHGFARKSLWELLEAKEIDEQTTELIFQLHCSSKSLKLWPYKFELLLKITVGRRLRLELTTKNCDTQTFEITAALHNYLAVENIDKVHVEGLDDKPCFDTVTGNRYTQQGSITICEEVDRIYRAVDYPVTLHDQTRTVRIDAEGSATAIVWNPWREKCVALADMDDDGYQTMLCIETANALDDARRLAPGAEHTLTAIISID